MDSPVLSAAKFDALLNFKDESYKNEVISLLYVAEETSLKDAILAVCKKAEEAVLNGTVVIVLSDRGLAEGLLPIHALLATARFIIT